MQVRAFPILNNIDTIHSDPWLDRVNAKLVTRAQSPVRVTTVDYERVHGRMPHGIGLWAFLVHSETVAVYGSFASARQQAVRYARSVHADEIRVQP